jgi:succinyl-diaminopimelate desuccinylase
MSALFKKFIVKAVLSLIAVPAILPCAAAQPRQFLDPGPIEKSIIGQRELFKEIEFPTQPDGALAFVQFSQIARTRVLQGHEYASVRAKLAMFEANPSLGLTSSGLLREEAAPLIRAYVRIRYNDDAAWSLSRFIKFQTYKSRMPSADNPEFISATKFLADLAARLKLRFKDLEGNFAEISLPGGEPPLGVVGHMDVVPAEETGWKYPPFSGAIAEGFVWGRGAQDDKGAVVSAIYALAGLLEARVRMKNRVVILVGTAEESTWEDVDYLFRRYSPPPLNIIIDSEYPVVFGEKGIMNVRFTSPATQTEKIGRNWEVLEAGGGLQPTMVPERAGLRVRSAGRGREAALKELSDLAAKFNSTHKGAKVSLAVGEDLLELQFSGTAAHAMNPEAGHNAIADMIQFVIDEMGIPDNGRGCMMRFLAEHIGHATDGSALGVGRSQTVLGSTTANMGTWVEKNGAVAVSVNIRFPTGLGIEEIKGTVERKVKKFNERTGCQIGYSTRGLPPVLVDTNSDIVRALMYSFKSSTGEDGEPVITGGTSYAKVFPNSVSFGPVMPGQEKLEHAVNERLPTAQITINAGIYATAILLLAGQP